MFQKVSCPAGLINHYVLQKWSGGAIRFWILCNCVSTSGQNIAPRWSTILQRKNENRWKEKKRCKIHFWRKIRIMHHNYESDCTKFQLYGKTLHLDCQNVFRIWFDKNFVWLITAIALEVCLWFSQKKKSGLFC